MRNRIIVILVVFVLMVSFVLWVKKGYDDCNAMVDKATNCRVEKKVVSNDIVYDVSFYVDGEWISHTAFNNPYAAVKDCHIWFNKMNELTSKPFYYELKK